MIGRTNYRGVTRHTTRPGWWRVKLKRAGKFYSFGVYRNPVRAAQMYDGLAKEIWGSDAVFNFDGTLPTGVTRIDIWDMLREKGLL